MRLQKDINIEGIKKVFVVKELTVAEIIDQYNKSEFLNSSDDKKGKTTTDGDNLPGEIGEMLRDLKQIVDVGCNFKMEDLKPLAPSEIKQIYNGFKEVNTDFFDFLQALGVTEALMEIKDVALNNFSKVLVSLLSRDI